MAISENLNTLEKDKFDEVDGRATVRTTSVGPTATTPSGLSVGGNIKQVELVASEWRRLPNVPRGTRNFLAVQNFSGSEIAVIHGDDYAAAADPNNDIPYAVGWKIINYGERNWDIRNGLEIWARASAGTLIVHTEELE